jgi:hypothetical protein
MSGSAFRELVRTSSRARAALAFRSSSDMTRSLAKVYEMLALFARTLSLVNGDDGEWKVTVTSVSNSGPNIVEHGRSRLQIFTGNRPGMGIYPHNSILM